MRLTLCDNMCGKRVGGNLWGDVCKEWWEIFAQLRMGVSGGCNNKKGMSLTIG